MTSRALRLLPWSNSDGQPCYLSTDTGTGMVSRLADQVEAEQLDNGSECVDYARELLDADVANVELDELRFLTAELTSALHQVLRIAHSRGARLDIPPLAEEPADRPTALASPRPAGTTT
ncbi:hypothetical protein HUT18_05550 [Streptomyces sp. NA04227]|uniref:hypothetical protein n=1 Tax=Streptomyces sp. NA04227 TaxID=2742136 RepID=UPI00158FD52A|nr:hypothetical protein [Streptomyces sp. NA04227]QKW05935.1 hypothetical protein HUT18_05550 [Streptomyces sp. NA04227]